MKQLIFSTITFLAFSISLFSQSGSSEIDRLYEKYKDAPEIELITIFGNIMGHVTISKNSNSLPQSITIDISTTNIDAAAKFVSEFIQQKLDAGYKSSDGITEYGAWEFEGVRTTLDFGWEKIFIFEKGNMYTKVSYSGKDKYSINKTEAYGFKTITYYITIETGDRSRLGGSNATKFDF